MRLRVQAVGLMVLMVLDPLWGCIGENKVESLDTSALTVRETE